MLKILMVADVLPNPHSGAAGTEWATMESLRSLGHQVETIWADQLRHRIRHGNLHYLAELPWAYRDAIAERCRHEHFDVIHVNQPQAWLAARDHRKQKRTGIFVNRSHGWEPRIARALRPWRFYYRVPEWRGPRSLAGKPMNYILDQWYPRWCAQASDGIIVSCEEDRNYVCRHYQIPDDRVACIAQAPSPVFVATPPEPMRPEKLRKVLYVGQAGFFKGPHILAEVFSRLAERHPGLSFTWCCPESAHQEWRMRLGPQAREQTTFCPWMPQEKLVTLYDDHGIFIFPSYTEGFGKVFLEAMARGLCVVATHAAGMRDVIRDGENGRLIAVGDVDGFVAAVEELLEGNKAREMSAAAASLARTYSWNRVALETASFYERLLKTKALE